MYEQFDAGYAANRFRSSADWFVSSTTGGVHTLRIGATGERAIDLVHALASYLPAEIRVAIELVRERQAWTGDACSRNEVRDVLARLKLLLAGFGGVEFALYTGDDQITLTPELEVVIYSHGESWAALLTAMGLEARESLPRAVWCPNRHALPPAPELTEAIEAAARRLHLTAAASDVVDS